jgi:hypothetical protein
MPGSRPTWYLTHKYVGRNQTYDLQKLQVAPLTVRLFLEGRDLLGLLVVAWAACELTPSCGYVEHSLP